MVPRTSNAGLLFYIIPLNWYTIQMGNIEYAQMCWLLNVKFKLC